MLYFIPISLFFIPVVYAAMNFGFAGAIATALWATVITIPNFVVWHEGLQRWGVIFQLAIVVAVAVFVGQRVDRERGARRQAEIANTALRDSETKYRDLFETSPIAILVLDTNGAILDANPAAGALFDKATGALRSMAMAELVGKENEQKLLAPSQKDNWQEASLVLRSGDGSETYLEPTHTKISDGRGNIAIQVLLKDITQERHRQAGLRAYAAHILRAQEEERQRIARELHDETIQTLVLLCRRLDNVGSSSKALPSSVKRELQEARKITEEAVRELRDFAKALRPTALDDLGVVTSIRRLLADCTERTGIQAQLKLIGKERRLSRDIELGMFRITQEALWNMERHSRATKVVVTTTFSKDEVRMDIKDNGLGFNVPPNLGTSGHLGLLGMQERAELLGGKWEIQSSPGKGVLTTISIPFPEKKVYPPAKVKER
jgi:PAS domain S-box-containing protein